MTGLRCCRVTKRKLLIMASIFWVAPFRVIVTTRIITLLGLGIHINLHLPMLLVMGDNPKHIMLQVLLCQQIMNKNIGM